MASANPNGVIFMTSSPMAENIVERCSGDRSFATTTGSDPEPCPF
jgi:hypothetical protein